MRLDDPVGRLSGGEAVLTALSARFLRRPAVLLLDEPTNNLDLDARRRLRDAVCAWSGVLLVISHDRELLSLVDQVADLSGGAPRDACRLAELIVRGPQRIALTGPNGAGKTTLLRALAAPGGRAAERGEPAGSGTAARGLTATVTVRRNAALGYLPQRLDVLDDTLTVAENVRAAAPRASVNEVRAGLARFLFRGARADQLAGTLSGGERFRAVLAALLLADPPPQLLLLDEPTNDLDMASARQLSQALSCYQGALIVVSHDLPFLRSAGITRWLRLDQAGRLAATGPL